MIAREFAVERINGVRPSDNDDSPKNVLLRVAEKTRQTQENIEAIGKSVPLITRLTGISFDTFIW